MSRTHESLAELDASRRRLLSEIEGLDDAHIQQRPASGGWSVAQAAEHVARVEEAIGRSIRAAAAGKLEVRVTPSSFLRDVVGRTIWALELYKYAGVRALPALDPKNPLPRAETLALLARNRESLLSAVQAVPLAGIRLRHPVFGPFSGEEMLRFAGIHEERHRLQIVRIKRALGVR